MNTRLIKFRVWDKKKNGFYLPKHLDDLFGGTITNSRSRAKSLLNVKPIAFIILDDLSERYAVQQFTGLKDKNGKEIYEGDILEDIKDYKSKTPISIKIEVKFGLVSEIIGFYYRHFGKIGGVSYNKTNPQIKNEKEVKIIGNIFENKELLG